MLLNTYIRIHFEICLSYIYIILLVYLQDTLILNNRLARNLLLGEPRKAITFNTEDLIDGLEVKYSIN